MKNCLVCLEGQLDFTEEVRTQTINIISFLQGQVITVNRDPISPGCNLTEHMSSQIDRAKNAFNQFDLLKMEKISGNAAFLETTETVFTFISGAGQKVWQVSLTALVTEQEIINFTSIYPDEDSMRREIKRLHYCVENFRLTGR